MTDFEFPLDNKMCGEPYIPENEEEFDEMLKCYLPKSDVPEKYLNMKILHLPLKKKWYDMIKSGEKKEEYRELSKYWIRRLTDIKSHMHELNTLIMSGKPVPKKEFTHVHFTLGYPKIDDAERNMIFEMNGIEIGTGKEEWGAEPQKNYFVIKLGKRFV